ncbi:hypothetical protein GGI17_001505 [Coemansia sp. S146]|nr:hypothetical protein GGI17_001505 [Coemansia sp. S146]
MVLSTQYQSAADSQQEGILPFGDIEPPSKGALDGTMPNGSVGANLFSVANDADLAKADSDKVATDDNDDNDGHGTVRNQGQKDEAKYIEVLGYDYKPQPASMPSWLPKTASHGKPSWSSSELATYTNESRIILMNNKDVAPQTLDPESDSLLILTPVKNNANHLARYFALVDKLKYPRDKISLAFLVSDSTDNTQQMLIESKRWYQEQAPEDMRFKRFDIFRQDFFYTLPRDQRHLRDKQRDRRIMMARARNYLWTRALGNEQWVLWIDGDLEYYPPSIVHDLMAYDKDVIVPNCLVRRKSGQDKWKHSVYDRNAWQETRKSRSMIKKLKDDEFLVEGYKSLKTHRKYLDNFAKNETIVPLDGVGGTFTLVKAHVHRSGVGFPTWLFQHQVETEGFAKLAKANGYGVKLDSFSDESRNILKNNKDIALQTIDPDSDSLLILTPLKNNAENLARYFELIDSLEYPRDKISIAFLVSDSTDNTQQKLIQTKKWYQE